MATLQGVYTATVVEQHDPEGLARVLVRVPGLPAPAGTTGVWARTATLMAGHDRGTLFLPEVGDEVLVAFERGELRTPYVLGALWNGKARPPQEATQAPGTVKLVRSRSGVTLRIRDTDKSVVIETPGGKRITLQDDSGLVRVEDDYGNTLTMTPAGIQIQGSAKVTIAAGATVEINAAQLTVAAGMSRFSGTVQCDTLIANSVVAASYTPGAGNMW